MTCLFSTRGAASLLLLLSFACADEAEEPARPPVELEVDFDSSQLPNGLKVLVVPNHTAPVVMGLLSVRTGAFSEPPELSGYSHLFEHMIFKGSLQLADPIAFRNRLDALGAVANATTSVDRVNYFFTTAREHAEAALGVYAEALITPAFDPAELEKEKTVVLAEFDLDESDAEYELYRRMLRQLFGDQSYRLNALGSRKVVEAVTSAQLRAAHARWYVPQNALLVLSGDLTPAEGQKWAAEHFGSWKKGTGDADPELPALESLSSLRYEVLKAEISETVIRVAWPMPGGEADDVDAAWGAALLSALTDQRDHPFRRLVQTELASSAWLTYAQYLGAGYIVAEMHVPFGHEAAVLDEFARAVDVLGDSSSFRDSDLREAQDVLWRRSFLSLTDPLSLPFAVAGSWLGDEPLEEIGASSVYEYGRGPIERLVKERIRDQPRVMLLLSSPDNLESQGIDAAWLAEHE